MKDYIINHFNILNLTYEPVANHLFYSYNFSEGYIDSFSINNQRLLNEVDTPLSIKEKILENQEKCKQYMQKLGMDIEKISQDTIEDFIKFREERIIETKLYIMENSDYGNKIYNELKIKCENNEIYYDQMESMCFEKIPYAFLTYYPEKEKIYHFIKYPIVSLYNEGIRGLDISLIHELIHKIEWNIRLMCGLNLHDEKNTNKIVNEIRTQKLAIKITHKLHNAKVFIYDNPNDYKIEGESDYERMFPLVSDFFEEYESFFKECAINNAIDKLEEKFGESWHDFSSYINYIFDLMEQSFKLNKNPIKNFIDKNMIETSLNLIQSMKEYSNHKARIA